MSPTTGIILNNEMDDFSVPDTDDTYSVKASAFNLVTVGAGWGLGHRKASDGINTMT